ncbi:rhomboid-related protein 2 [Anopheles stephensi]|uniref:rhomboid-related protein 2 n=1 Tax=Anopheles stephensi TaxID=30069 RepID=UPI0016587320|nr:rhomboid-related protein 2 [Anopheles stephensi]XP_035908898.1 rhomboid-related protein 2 [Anopheles stephensi]XP_035908900.1 rhomboid-related protein 2 [Anopheles stephensi]XP_035908901.1 rhomboid-related protein 2 [Anopheles stephensi]XP_035908902.1 rhomboid-related protein 2 [Anopheles stephensi]XP_035908903.1 rhomboid-related protein 2 [Anopheles stephensi]XP_035908904.1 rhomboid-related protein 2 [Anopheles stephensi]XP_035908905.1 rhomboid-related protein 2 [Anopheles stephensi]XP_
MPAVDFLSLIHPKKQQSKHPPTPPNMTDSRKPPAKVVPVHRGKLQTSNAITMADTCQRAWIESDRHRSQPESEREPFLTTGSGSEASETSSLECEQLCTGTRAREKKKARIFSIDLERGLGGGRCDRAAEPGTPSGSVGSTGTSSVGGSSSNDDSHSDAKLVDKLRKVNRRKRKQRPASRTAKLLQLCQCCPWTVPWSLLIVSALQIAIFTYNNDAINQQLIFSPVKQYEVWRFVTYTFLHAGNVHLVLNIIIQILVAFPLETEQGHGKVLLVYFAGTLAGALGASVFEPTLMVGASAGVYCLLMSHIPHIIMNFRTLSYRYYRLIAVLMLCISDVMYSIRHCLTKGNLQPRIGVAAHISGALCGLLIGFVVYRSKVAPDTTKEVAVFRALRYLASVLLLAWLGCTVLYNLDRSHVIQIL